MQIPYLTKSIDVYEIDKGKYSQLKFRKFLEKTEIIDHQKKVKQSIINQIPSLILLPLTEFEFIVVDFPDIDEEEMEQWVVEYFANHNSQNASDYWLNYQHLNPDSMDHKILIISLSKSKYDNILQRYQEIENPVYVGAGIESLGLVFSLNEELLNKKNVVVFSSPQKTFVLEYTNSLLSNFHQFDDVDISNIAKDDTNTIVWNIAEKKNNVSDIFLNEKKIESIDFRKTGLILNYFYKITKSLNLIDETKTEVSNSVVEKSNALKTGINLTIIFIVLFSLPMIADFINNNSLRKLNTDLTLIDDKLSLIENKQNEIKLLKKELIQSRDIVHTASHFNGYLELIGRNVPESVKLEHLQISEQKEAHLIIIKGTSVNKTAITKLLSNLEGEKVFKSVELKFIETKTEDDNTGSSDSSIFEIGIII